MDLVKLRNTLLENGYTSYRLKQVKKHVFRRLISNWSEATDLPEKLRDLLLKNCPVSELILVKEEESKKGDTVKALFKTSDGFLVEAVLMKHDRDRRTVCVSSQVGCAMSCSFCATGQMGFKRNLTAGEIVDQVLYFARDLAKQNKKVTNVVYMGMGEPFNNYENVMDSVHILNDKDGFNLGARHISISTSGIVSGIRRFSDEKLQVNLAVSLHAPADEIRSKIMPVNRAYPLRKLMPVISEYVKKTRRKVMFEYILLGGINDSDECAERLGGLMRKNKLYHVNLIKYHRTYKDGAPTYRRSPEKQMNKFFDILKKAGISCTFRVSFGEDISGACGQLAGCA